MEDSRAHARRVQAACSNGGCISITPTLIQTITRFSLASSMSTVLSAPDLTIHSYTPGNTFYYFPHCPRPVWLSFVPVLSLPLHSSITGLPKRQSERMVAGAVAVEKSLMVEKAAAQLQAGMNVVRAIGGAIIEMLPVPDDLKDRKAGFGYFIDDAFLGDYHGEKGKRYSRDSKISIVRNIAEMAECYPVILSSYSGAAVVPCFATHNARLIHQGPTAVEELDLFKQLLSIDRDPRWYELVVHVAYMHIQRNVTQNVTLRMTIGA
ncbi:hypothetical protein F5887DRAFT_1162995 [Amanita rubescens]|nr:hypothetical protein F5887DRAFT_1162995 [Amanita rubescens]